MAKKPKTYQLREVTHFEVIDFWNSFFEGQGKRFGEDPRLSQSVFQVKNGSICVLVEDIDEETGTMVGWVRLYGLDLHLLVCHFIEAFSLESKITEAK